MKSIIDGQDGLCQCFNCGSLYNLEEHHIFYGNKNRKLSEKHGLKVLLCEECHRGTNGVHGKNGHKLDIKLKQIAEEKWLEVNNKSIEDFIKIFGKNYI